MKSGYICSICCLMLLSTLALGQSIETPNGFRIKTGVNLGLWLSQSEKRGIEREQFIVQSDFNKISSLGFDHIRLPIDEVQFWDEQGNKQKDAFELLHRAIQWAMSADLRVIVDLHIIRSHYFNAASNALWTDPKEQEKLVDLWEQLSGELSRYSSDKVAYEFMNEAVAKEHEDWNKLVSLLYQSMRGKEPRRTLVIGSNRWQGYETFPFLKVPSNDLNLILSFHYYRPFALTHYKTSWTSLKNYDGKVFYPGEVVPRTELDKVPEKIRQEIEWATGHFDKARLSTEIEIPVKIASELNLPLYCGEFGVFSTAPEDAALRWYRDLTEVFRENNIAFSHWAYRGSFSIVDDQLRPKKALVDLLVK